VDSKGISFIKKKIPHRDPFLWLDKVLDLKEESIVAEKFISPDLDLWQGHYPDYPLMPGVLLCEAVFQAGALLLSNHFSGSDSNQLDSASFVPVLTRIYGARFKREVKPGDCIRIQVNLKERLGPAWIMKGKIIVDGKTAITVEFCCTAKG